jgi:hypothetical protein
MLKVLRHIKASKMSLCSVVFTPFEIVRPACATDSRLLRWQHHASTSGCIQSTIGRIRREIRSLLTIHTNFEEQHKNLIHRSRKVTSDRFATNSKKIRERIQGRANQSRQRSSKRNNGMMIPTCVVVQQSYYYCPYVNPLLAFTQGTRATTVEKEAGSKAGKASSYLTGKDKFYTRHDACTPNRGLQAICFLHNAQTLIPCLHSHKDQGYDEFRKEKDARYAKEDSNSQATKSSRRDRTNENQTKVYKNLAFQ